MNINWDQPKTRVMRDARNLVDEYTQPGSLRALRAATGLTGTRVAELMHATQPGVSRLETGPHRPRDRTLSLYFAAVGRHDLCAAADYVCNQSNGFWMLDTAMRWEALMGSPLVSDPTMTARLDGRMDRVRRGAELGHPDRAALLNELDRLSRERVARMYPGTAANA